MAKLTAETLGDDVQAWWGRAPRLFMLDATLGDSYDHYPQLTVYLRMNAIVPPASRPKQQGRGINRPILSSSTEPYSGDPNEGFPIPRLS